MNERSGTNLNQIIGIRELEHLSRQHSHYAVKLVGRCHRHDTTNDRKKTT